MPDSYPYIISNNKIEPILAKIRTAAKPERFSIRETLAKWGFAATNDRAMIPVLKELGFLNDSGAPTQAYDRLRDPSDWRYVLAERIRDTYSDLYGINTEMHTAPEEEIRGAISRVTGKDGESVKRYYATFKTLASLANFEPKSGKQKPAEAKPEERDTPSKSKVEKDADEHPERRRTEYHYNIQIHLPATTDITVYNAIFKSLKEHIGG